MSSLVFETEQFLLVYLKCCFTESVHREKCWGKVEPAAKEWTRWYIYKMRYMWQTYDHKRRKKPVLPVLELELEEDTYVGNTCIKILKVCLFLGQVEDSDKYLRIGEGDQNEVKVTNNNSFKETIELINISIYPRAKYSQYTWDSNWVL